MERLVLPDETLRAIEAIRAVDIVVGIPSYNNSRTIGHVVSAASLGLAKYFGNYTSLIVNFLTIPEPIARALLWRV